MKSYSLKKWQVKVSSKIAARIIILLLNIVFIRLTLLDH